MRESAAALTLRSHPDQAARAEYQAGADLKSVAAAWLESGWAWGALGAAALGDGDPVAAYSHAFLGQALAFRALREAGWADGQPVDAAALLSAMVTAQAAEALGEDGQAARAKAFVAELGHDVHDAELLAALTR
ncbi:MAG: DUF3151 family protein [Bifidobacteriaceae bacterium]|jgi:hypothetical protein|nr:DUF3151 family protein [Bifidobacteriaceae bacterium]